MSVGTTKNEYVVLPKPEKRPPKMGEGPMGLPRCSGDPMMASSPITVALTSEITATACHGERQGTIATIPASINDHAISVSHAPQDGEPKSHQGIAPIRYRLTGKVEKNSAVRMPMNRKLRVIGRFVCAPVMRRRNFRRSSTQLQAARHRR